MHPALSVIFFTVVSGTGYGLLFLLGLGLAIDPQIAGRNEALTVLATGMVFAAAGLLSSTLHLGQPQRAWRAFSQWRSSWLSREGVASVCSFAPVLAIGFCLWHGADAYALRGLGVLLAALAVVTVCCTAKIYTSLKTIHAWHNRYVLPGYLLLGLLGGSVWLLFVHGLFAPQWFTYSELKLVIVPVVNHLFMQWIVALLVLLLAVACVLWKALCWRFLDRTRHVATPESATGLGRFGAVRSVEAPHTEENYLTREMGFALARKHAARLRTICLVLIGPLPVLLVLPVLVAPIMWSTLTPICTCAAALFVTAGSFIERWLFFAEARHVVMLYYGALHYGANAKTHSR